MASGCITFRLNWCNLLNTTSYGTGELIVAALERGVKRIILGIGGSATNDGGAMMQALGVILRDKQRLLSPGGEALAALASIDLSGCHPLLRKVSITAWRAMSTIRCVVPCGASAILAHKRGDSGNGEHLDAALENPALAYLSGYGREVINVLMRARQVKWAPRFRLLIAELRAGVEIVETLA